MLLPCGFINGLVWSRLTGPADGPLAKARSMPKMTAIESGKFMRIVATILVGGLLTVAALAAAGWSHYSNARFGYSFDLPPGFSSIVEADNGDGGASRSADGSATLLAWGGNLIEDLVADSRYRIDAARSEGWDISYNRHTPNWASWSGGRGGRVFYARAIQLCGDQAAYFQVEYPKHEVEAYGPVVERLVKSLKNDQRC